VTAGAVCAALAALSPAPALATPAWLAPLAVSGSGVSATRPAVAVDALGEAVAVWEATGSIIQAAVRPAGGTWGTPVQLSLVGEKASEPRVAVDAQGEATVVWEESGLKIRAAVRPAGAAWQAPVQLSLAGEEAVEPQVAIDPKGDAVAVWMRFGEKSAQIIQSAARPAASGAWQTPAELSRATGDAEHPEVAMDANGDAVAVWDIFGETDKVIEASERPAVSGVWQTPAVLSDPSQQSFEPQIALDPQGDAIAVWAETEGLTNEVVQSAVRPVATGLWGTPVELSAPGAKSMTPQVALDGQGSAVAVWERNDGTSSVIQSASRPAGTGTWGTPVGLSAEAEGKQAIAPQLAVSPQGAAIAVWTRNNGSDYVAEAAVGSTGTSLWQAPVELSVGNENADGVQVAADGQGNALAVWELFNGSSGTIEGEGYDGAGPLLDGLVIPATGTVDQPLSFSVSPLDVWSALRATSWSFGDGAAAGGASVTHTYSAPGSYTVTVSSADVLGNLTSASGTVTISYPTCPAAEAAATSGTGVCPVSPFREPPVLSKLSESAKTWRAGHALARISATRNGHSKLPPLGTTFSFTLNEPASVTFTFTRPASGRRVGRTCVAQTKKNEHKRRCTRTVVAGTLTFTARGGTNAVRFEGRLSAHKKLGPGSYTLLALATSTGRHSVTRTLHFTITKR